MDKQMYWYNFRTGGHDLRTSPQTDSEAVNYLPQWPPALNLYHLYRQMGDSISEASVRVLTLCVGENP